MQPTKEELMKKCHREAYDDVISEVVQQLAKWGIQQHTFEEWKAIIIEEFAEMQTEVIVAKKDGYNELKQTVAVGMSWVMDILMSRKELKCSQKKKLS